MAETVSPIAAVIAAFREDDSRVVGQVVIRRDGTVEHYGDESVCIETLSLVVRSGQADILARLARFRRVHR